MKVKMEGFSSESIKSNYNVIAAARESVKASTPSISYSKVSGSAVKDVVASINKKINYNTEKKSQ